MFSAIVAMNVPSPVAGTTKTYWRAVHRDGDACRMGIGQIDIRDAKAPCVESVPWAKRSGIFRHLTSGSTRPIDNENIRRRVVIAWHESGRRTAEGDESSGPATADS